MSSSKPPKAGVLREAAKAFATADHGHRVQSAVAAGLQAAQSKGKTLPPKITAAVDQVGQRLREAQAKRHGMPLPKVFDQDRSNPQAFAATTRGYLDHTGMGLLSRTDLPGEWDAARCKLEGRRDGEAMNPIDRNAAIALLEKSIAAAEKRRSDPQWEQWLKSKRPYLEGLKDFTPKTGLEEALLYLTVKPPSEVDKTEAYQLGKRTKDSTWTSCVGRTRLEELVRREWAPGGSQLTHAEKIELDIFCPDRPQPSTPAL